MLTLTIVVPLKRNSQRVKDKNFREIDGVPLYQRAISKALDLQRNGGPGRGRRNSNGGYGSR